jgi:hypothetical protein
MSDFPCPCGFAQGHAIKLGVRCCTHLDALRLCPHHK